MWRLSSADSEEKEISALPDLVKLLDPKGGHGDP